MEHPSNKLLNGDATSFRDAMHLVAAECAYELRVGEPSSDDELDKQANAVLVEFQEQAKLALAVYDNEVVEAEKRAVQKMREVGLEPFAEALESGDYSALAI